MHMHLSFRQVSSKLIKGLFLAVGSRNEAACGASEDPSEQFRRAECARHQEVSGVSAHVLCGSSGGSRLQEEHAPPKVSLADLRIIRLNALNGDTCSLDF